MTLLWNAFAQKTRRFRTLPLWQRGLAFALVVALTMVRVALTVRRGEPPWTPFTQLPLYLLVGWNLLAAFDSGREARKLQALENEAARLEGKIARRQLRR